uniref:Uncharacterized protein n=1 Tax=Anopheles merus TaxID=30066 RepID=A0A182UZK7_ANOME
MQIRIDVLDVGQRDRFVEQLLVERQRETPIQHVIVKHRNAEYAPDKVKWPDWGCSSCSSCRSARILPTRSLRYLGSRSALSIRPCGRSGMLLVTWLVVVVLLLLPVAAIALPPLGPCSMSCGKKRGSRLTQEMFSAQYTTGEYAAAYRLEPLPAGPVPFGTCGPAPDSGEDEQPFVATPPPPVAAAAAAAAAATLFCRRIICRMCMFIRGSVNWVVRLLWSTKYTRPDAVLRCSQPCGSGPSVSVVRFCVSKSRGIRGSCQVDCFVGMW